MAIKKNLNTFAGTTMPVSIRYKDSNGTPVNLTGHTVRFVVRPAGRPAAAPLFTKVANVTVDGWVTFKLTDEESLTLPLGTLAYSINHETPDGDITPMFWGALEVRSGVEV